MEERLGVGKVNFEGRDFLIPSHVEVSANLEHAGICSLLKPLPRGVHVTTKGGAAKAAVVFGAETIGLVSMLALKDLGVEDIIVVDTIDSRLNRAVELGASHVINGKDFDVVQSINDITKGRGVDLAIETANTEVNINQAIRVTRKGTTVILAGLSNIAKLNIEISLAINKELTLYCIHR